MTKSLSALAFALLCSCASPPPKTPGPSGLLYPPGTYQHKVKVQITSPARAIDLRGVVKSAPDSLKVVGLSSFNTTVFRITEDLKTGEIEKDFYVDTIRRNEEKFMFFYQLMKELQLATKGQTEFERQGATFKISSPDENQIYRMVEISHPQVKLNIEVTGYEF